MEKWMNKEREETIVENRETVEKHWPKKMQGSKGQLDGVTYNLLYNYQPKTVYKKASNTRGKGIKEGFHKFQIIKAS